ncbi:unnamed protein product [Dicrocoelium dendriticum]|nr:unnamed protein product [Dicrocoelium dendriticum]
MHSRLDLPIESIQQWPSALTASPHLLPQRATFLVRRGLLQLDPKKPLYTPLSKVVEGSDAQFCQNFARVDEQKYNTFLKTL